MPFVQCGYQWQIENLRSGPWFPPAISELFFSEHTKLEPLVAYLLFSQGKVRTSFFNGYFLAVPGLIRGTQVFPLAVARQSSPVHRGFSSCGASGSVVVTCGLVALQHLGS